MIDPAREKQTYPSTKCIISKDGTLILEREREKIIKTWNEYKGECFYDDRGQLKILRNMEESEILKWILESVLAKLNRLKSAKTHRIIKEIQAALNDFGIDQRHNKGNIQHCDIPEDLNRFIFSALHKKVRTNECEFHRTKSLTSHWTKELFLMNEARSRLRPQIGRNIMGSSR